MRDLFTSFKDNCGFGLLASIDNTPSHKNLEDAVTSLSRMMHRGAVAADGKTGDGAGLLLSMPKSFFAKEASSNGVHLPENYAVAMVFSNNPTDFDVIADICENNDLKIIYTRTVPVDTNALGKQALASLPTMKQIFVAPNSPVAINRFEALVYLSRKEIEAALIEDETFYIPSFSTSVISYKGLVMPTHIKEFYMDLADPNFEISFCLFHQRFSTNTLPQWKLAQPFRMIAHNGEINSVTANRFNVKAKMAAAKSDIFSDDEMDRLRNVLQDGMSDSASLDNFMEFLRVNGVDFFKAARSLIPAPWHNNPQMDTELRAFYEYASATFEPWDGPAAVSMTDGRYIGCVLDRNGLRPSKYIRTKDNRLIISSEYGVLNLPDEEVVERGRLQSGEMMGIDLKHGKVLTNSDINDYLKAGNAYDKWLTSNLSYLQEHVPNTDVKACEANYGDMTAKQRYFNYTTELIREVIRPMLNEGKETTGSMGDDTPLAAFSTHQRNFTDFFKQKFAQVTNPPIDPIREKTVMSLNTGFGESHNVLTDSPEHAKRLKTVLPIMSAEKFCLIQEFGNPSNEKYDPSYKIGKYDTTYKGDLQESLYALTDRIIDDVRRNGVRVIILDDRNLNAENKVIPMLMAVGRLNQELLKARIRHLTSIVAVTGEVFDPHSAACILSFGAAAIFPYLLYHTVEELIDESEYDALPAILKQFRRSIGAGLMKIMSKMGISTLASYRNSRLFDVIGLSDKIVEDCFEGAKCLLPGLGYEDIDSRLNSNHERAFTDAFEGKKNALYKGGFYKYKKGEEFHDFSRPTISAMQKASESGSVEDYSEVKKLVNERDKKFIRDFYELKSDREPISIDEVEPISEIFKRFSTAAMSMGSISQEAHETLAVAMNRIGGKSNSGEGGESPLRYGTEKNSSIKQVASGRFGVTPEYLRSATELQIKVAQGAKPGEGGQLPGSKVSPLIAELRFTKPGVTLISPPPHHDIYSIEDLAQLIFDLKQVNPNARVAVKLVSTAGVGTIAAGVAKCYADKIIISGADGGTGAAPIGSIRFAGNSWELGLIEAHNALKANHLRGQVSIETDGGLKTGLDVVKAAILGAEEYAFGTGALVLVGCMMLRVCHLNTCGVGVATQDPLLRERFTGNVEKVVNYFTLVATEVREILASLGYKSLDDVIGQNKLLKVIDDEFAEKFNFSELLYDIEGDNTCQVPFNEPYDQNEYEKEILEELMETIKDPSKKIVLNKDISNLNRSFATRISGEIAAIYGNAGLPEDTITLNVKGTTGQSLGAFLAEGVTINVHGAGNDYIGKGMSGGKIVITSENAGHKFALGGNTCLYGATGGSLYIHGKVGERFGVRNSGATTVVEGTGDHPCEYMTGGIAVILGETGVNFGAGMTGGKAFVYDMDGKFYEKVNPELVEPLRIDTDEWDSEMFELKRLLADYVEKTGSKRAAYILENFRSEIRKFWMVAPRGIKPTIVTGAKGE